MSNSKSSSTSSSSSSETLAGNYLEDARDVNQIGGQWGDGNQVSIVSANPDVVDSAIGVANNAMWSVNAAGGRAMDTADRAMWSVNAAAGHAMDSNERMADKTLLSAERLGRDAMISAERMGAGAVEMATQGLISGERLAHDGLVSAENFLGESLDFGRDAMTLADRSTSLALTEGLDFGRDSMDAVERTAAEGLFFGYGVLDRAMGHTSDITDQFLRETGWITQSAIDTVAANSIDQRRSESEALLSTVGTMNQKTLWALAAAGIAAAILIPALSRK